MLAALGFSRMVSERGPCHDRPVRTTLLIVDNQVAVLSGDLSVHSDPACGTRIRAVIPCE